MRGLSNYERNGRLGQADGLLNALTQSTGNQPGVMSSVVGQFNNEIVVRSQVTPEIRIDVNQLLKGGAEQPKEAVKGQGNFFLNFIRPEIELNLLGTKQSVAPYGKPAEDMMPVLIASIAGLMTLGGAIAFFICKKVL